MEDVAKKYFDPTISERERAIFELGIALGFAYHQFIGLPFNKENAKIIERAIEQALVTQPFRVSAKVKLKSKKKKGVYSYDEISKNNMEVEVEVVYGKIRAKGRLKYIKEIKYPLMFIEKIEPSK